MKKAGKGRGKDLMSKPWRPLYWMPLLTAVLCVISAQLILWGKLSESAIKLLPRIMGGVVSFLGAFRSTGIASQQRFLWGMISTVSYGCILMLANLLFFGETFTNIGSMFLWILTGGFLGSLLSNMKKGKIA